MDLLQNSPEWHEWRRGGIGASEVAAILGICPYNTPNDIWLVKTKRQQGFEGNSFTRHGQETEAKARARYELINLDDMPPAIVQHPKYPICRASLDGFSEDKKVILEIKCPKGLQTLEAARAGVVPYHYKPQVQWQLAASGADLLHFFVYHEGCADDALVPVRPIVEYQGELIAKCDDWWKRYVVTDTPPPLTDRDVLIIEDNEQINEICELILVGKDEYLTKPELDAHKAEVIKLAGHPKVRCGRVQISTVLRNDKFSYHKLTIKDEA